MAIHNQKHETSANFSGIRVKSEELLVEKCEDDKAHAESEAVNLSQPISDTNKVSGKLMKMM